MKTKSLFLLPALIAALNWLPVGQTPAQTVTTLRAVVCALGILTAASCAYAAATITPLGYAPGDNSSSAAGVNGDGSVVVGASEFQPYSGAGSYQGFRWTAGSGMLGLGHLPGDSYSQAYAVSGDGSVVVGTSQHVWLTDGQAFRWTAGSGMAGLGYLPGATSSSAAAVNGNGSVIVGVSGNQAFRWTAGSGMVGLGYLPGGTNSSAPRVSADGSVIIGTSSSASSGSQAFRWTAGTGVVGLGYLPGGTNSSAAGVSADGSIIIGTSSSASGIQAFRWTASSGMVALGMPAGTYGIVGVSGDGSIVVGNDSNEPFLWTAGSGIQSLSPLYIARGISADGDTIVGWAESSDDGRPEAFIATIPGLIAASPLLSINSSLAAANQLVLSWPTNYTGFTLQWSAGFGSTNWTNCASPTVSGAYFVVTNQMSAGAQFFRLKRWP